MDEENNTIMTKSRPKQKPQPSIRELTHDEVFHFTALKVERALGATLAEIIPVKNPDSNHPEYLGYCFLKTNGVAHIVYYPGVINTNGIPLFNINTAIENELKKHPRITSHVKHITLGLHNKTYTNENDFIAIVEENNKSTIIYPRPSNIEYLSAKEKETLKLQIPNLENEVKAANVTSPLPRNSNGIYVAHIHAHSANQICLKEALAKHEAEIEAAGFIKTHPILTGILIASGIGFLITALIATLVLTGGAGAIGIGLGAFAAWIGTSTAVTVTTGIAIGITLGSICAGIGAGIGAGVNWLSQLFQGNKPQPPHDPDVEPEQSSSTKICNSMGFINTNELIKRGDAFAKTGKLLTAIHYYQEALSLNKRDKTTRHKYDYLADITEAEYLIRKGNKSTHTSYLKRNYDNARNHYDKIKGKHRKILPEPNQFYKEILNSDLMQDEPENTSHNHDDLTEKENKKIIVDINDEILHECTTKVVHTI